MSDGPFKNLKLGKRWRLFTDAVQNDAFGKAERHAFASDALVREILTHDVKPLLLELTAYANREQLDFNCVSSSIEEIFNPHSKTSFTDILQKELAFRVSEQVPIADAIIQAVDAAVREQISEVKNRIIEECICQRDLGGMWQDQFNRTVRESSVILNGLATSEICQVVLAGNEKAFKAAVSKKVGIDEGVDL
jgi:hypothetical protein